MALGGLVVGKDVFAKIYVALTPGGNATPWKILAKSIRVQEQAVKAADGVCGEQRDRLQKITNFYQVTVDCFDDGRSSALLTTWLAQQQNDDLTLPQLPLSSGLIWKYLDGSAGGVTFNGCNIDPLDYNVAGRTERAIATVGFRAQYMSQSGVVTP